MGRQTVCSHVRDWGETGHRRRGRRAGLHHHHRWHERCHDRGLVRARHGCAQCGAEWGAHWRGHWRAHERTRYHRLPAHGHGCLTCGRHRGRLHRHSRRHESHRRREGRGRRGIARCSTARQPRHDRPRLLLAARHLQQVLRAGRGRIRGPRHVRLLRMHDRDVVRPVRHGQRRRALQRELRRVDEQPAVLRRLALHPQEGAERPELGGDLLAGEEAGR
mmetsp:Transcript_9515/g.24674  ORF Transcript_9515/g.24674 Transcript_9515/m.24674 type:complete len:219 (-) Transcript_9515:726-1382(-)